MEYDTNNGKIIEYHPKEGTEKEYKARIYSRVPKLK